MVQTLCPPPEVVGTSLPGTRTLGWEVWCGAGSPRVSRGTAAFNQHTWVGPAQATSPPLLPVSGGLCGSLVVGLSSARLQVAPSDGCSVLQL